MMGQAMSFLLHNNKAPKTGAYLIYYFSLGIQ